MLIPSSWNRLKRKRLSVIENDCPEGVEKNATAEVDVTHLKGIVTRHLEHAAAAPDAPEDWDWLLSKLSIAKMLQSTALPPAKSVPIITRQYEESCMRECKNDFERPCIFQAQCECMKINPSNAFVGV